MSRGDTLQKERWRLRRPGANTCGANWIDWPAVSEAEAREEWSRNPSWTILEVRRSGQHRFKVVDQRSNENSSQATRHD